MNEEYVRALAESVLRDDDVGNAVVGVLVEPGQHVGFRIERIAEPAAPGAPLLVHASRRSLAAGILEELS